MEPLLGTDRSGPRAAPGRRWVRENPGWLGLLFCPLFALLPGVVAAEPDAGEFQVDVRTAYEADAGWTTTWVWTVGARQFWIAPLPEWSLGVNLTNRRLEVLNTNRTSAITLAHTVLTNAPSAQDLRSLVAKRHEGFQVIAEHTLNSGCGSAVVFDLLLAEQGERVRPAMAAWRTALIVSEGGLLECTLRTSVRSQPDLLRTFDRFLVGLRPPPPDAKEPGR